MVAAAVRYLSWFAVAILCCSFATASTGCVVVRAHERGHLAKRAMTDDRDPGETRFVGHERGSREGAEGGAGQPGGGCGCN
ncbi:MAG TPA: DUF4266 domain-containing protein [Kofleriaceae bacterium]|jgi:hypothetical protein|nr:DUF4266 domain-containing protein [Kofleriaceae bacterium]